MGSCVENWHPDTRPAPYQLKTDHHHRYVQFYALCWCPCSRCESSFQKRFIGSGLVRETSPAEAMMEFFFPSHIRFGTGHFQLVSSTTGHTKLINFLRTTPLPNGAAALRGPVHNVVMTRRSKVVWPVPQLRRKIAIARCIVFVWEEGGQQWPVYILIYVEKTFIPEWYKMLPKLQMLHVVHTEYSFSS